jgi:hypothetical protein
MGIGCVHAFLVSRFQDSGGRRTFSLAGRPGVSGRLHDSDPREFGVEQHIFDPREFSRARPAGPAGSEWRAWNIALTIPWKRPAKPGPAKPDPTKSNNPKRVPGGGMSCCPVEVTVASKPDTVRLEIAPAGDFVLAPDFRLAPIRYFHSVEFVPPAWQSGRDTLLETHLLRV